MSGASALLAAALLVHGAPAHAEEEPGSPPPGTLQRSWLVPALETPALDVGIWGVARVTNGTRAPDRSIRWPDVILDYPYHGSLFFTAARSSGLGFWESALYPLLGSLFWELFLEAQTPSVNDQITTTFGGVFLGEALFRSSDMLLHGGGERPGLLRQVGSFLVAPMAGVNRLAFGYTDDVERPIASLSVFSAGAGGGWSAPAPGVETRTGWQGAGDVQQAAFVRIVYSYVTDERLGAVLR